MILAFLLTPLGRYLAGAIAILAILGAIYLKGKSDGKDNAIEAINEDTAKAFEAAREAARNVDQCYALDGVRWNIARAKCERYP